VVAGSRYLLFYGIPSSGLCGHIHRVGVFDSNFPSEAESNLGIDSNTDNGLKLLFLDSYRDRPFSFWRDCRAISLSHSGHLLADSSHSSSKAWRIDELCVSWETVLVLNWRNASIFLKPGFARSITPESFYKPDARGRTLGRFFLFRDRISLGFRDTAN